MIKRSSSVSMQINSSINIDLTLVTPSFQFRISSLTVVKHPVDKNENLFVDIHYVGGHGVWETNQFEYML